jgi:hypothetical protein
MPRKKAVKKVLLKAVPRPKSNEAAASVDVSKRYLSFLAATKERIRNAQVGAALAANAELVRLYWQLGNDILAEEKARGWGAKFVERLATDLHREFPAIKGFSPRNL